MLLVIMFLQVGSYKRDCTESTIMIGTLTVFMVAVCMPVAFAQTANTCGACNCQFSNFQRLTQLIDERINAAQMNEPS